MLTCKFNLQKADEKLTQADVNILIRTLKNGIAHDTIRKSEDSVKNFCKSRGIIAKKGASYLEFINYLKGM